MILFNPQWTSKTSESAVKPAETKPAPVAPVAVEAGHEASNRLLVVDDNPSTCNFVKKVAVRSGYHVIAVHSAPEFMAVYDEANPTICILDLQLEGDDGVELITFLAERKAKAAVAVMSGFDVRVLEGVGRLAKDRGLNVVGLFAKPIVLNKLRDMLVEQRVDEPLDPVAELERGIDAGQVIPYYQPKVDLVTGAVIGAEALARWLHPKRGLVSPGEFIPLAEENDLIEKLTTAIMRGSLSDQAAWEARGLPLSVAVNVSVKTIRRELADEIVQMIRANRVQPERLIVEVTESAAMTDPNLALEVFSRIRLKGVGLAIDDFGTGYSNLVMLQRMPFSEMKIDRSFTEEILTNSGSRAIVKAIIELGHALGMKVVAEGVSSKPIMAEIRAMGADIAQGFYIARPMPAGEFLSWHEQYPGARA